MRDALDRLPLERALQGTLAALILVTVLASGSLLGLVSAAQKAKWAVLVALAALAVLHAARIGARPPSPAGYAAATAFVALAFLSVAWSASPGSTFGRAGALALVLVAAGALGAGAAGRPAAVRGLLGAIVAGVALVGIGGLLVLLFEHDRAVQPATTVMAARYQGLGGGPDTATMVLALGTPAAAFFTVASRGGTRIAALLVLALALGSIAASGSRGALVAAAAGLAAFALLATRGARRRALALGCVAALFVATLLAARIPQPLEGSVNPPEPAPSYDVAPAPPEVPESSERPVHPVPPPRLQDDVGHPPFGIAETRKKPRTLFGTSGRAEAWQGALELGAERPVVGYAFGTEDRVFVDRYVDFNSNTVESSYLGLFLQLGLAGLGALLLAVGLLVRGAVAQGLRGPPERAPLAAACAAVAAAGLALALFQSYLYAAGNNATATFWVGAFLAAATAGEGLLRRPARRTLLRAGAVVLAAAVSAVLVGRWERERRAEREVERMARTVAAVGPLDQPALDAYRWLSPGFQCLLYKRGRDPFALELCVDEDARIVETIDRRTAPEPRIASLRDDPSRSTLRVDGREFDRLLGELGVEERFLVHGKP